MHIRCFSPSKGDAFVTLCNSDAGSQRVKKIKKKENPWGKGYLFKILVKNNKKIFINTQHLRYIMLMDYD